MTLPSESPASGFATALLAELVRRGIRDLVICPGSRSQALALAAADLERAGVLRVRVRIDERSAGFLALGLAIETGVPVPIVMTSGTAVANLHPAVLEASHSGVPLIGISADRPEELRGIGANQTTVQPGMFASAVRAEWDVPAPDADTDVNELARSLADAVLAHADGPVHLNLGFREPLSAALPAAPVSAGVWTAPRRDLTAHRLEYAPGTVVIAGAGAGERAEEVARELGVPLLAEVTSGARFGPNLVPAYTRLLREHEVGGAVRRAIVFGHPTLVREVPRLLQRDDVETVIVRSPGREDLNPGRRATAIVDEVEVVPDDRAHDDEARGWLGRWVFASRELLAVEEAPAASLDDDYATRARFARDQLERLRAPVTRRDLAEAVWAATWPHDRLVLAASRLIRDADAVVPGKRITAHANRGLAGIDGTIATAIGIALAAQETREGFPRKRDSDQGGTTRVLLGDLALLHDAGSLLFPDGEARPRIQLIVGNDHGGTIFDSLEVAASADAASFDRVMLTPQSVDLAALAAAYGWEYRRVVGHGDLMPSLTASAGPVLIEVPLTR